MNRTTLVLIAVTVCCLYGGEVSFKWDEAQPTNNVVGYAVLLATNGGTWETNAIRPRNNRFWSNSVPTGDWKLGVQPILSVTNQAYDVWSLGFRVGPHTESFPIYSGGQMRGTLVREGKAYRVILNPQVITNLVK